jgi:predicted RNase H-like nuclease
VRLCDCEARDALGAGAVAVELIPPRGVLEATSFDAARALSAKLAGPEPSEAIFALRAKILEAEQLALALAHRAPSATAWGNERLAGPYAEFPTKDGRRARWAKRLNSPEGMRRLARVIQPRRGHRPRRHTQPLDARVAGPVVQGHAELSYRQMAGHELVHAPGSAQGTMERAQLLREAGIHIPAELGDVGGVPVAELLDAAALAWTAFRYQRGLATSLPAREHWQRDHDRIVAIWT